MLKTAFLQSKFFPRKKKTIFGAELYVQGIPNLAEEPSVLPSHQRLSSQLLLHPSIDFNETWYRCCTASLEVHVRRYFMFGKFWKSYAP